MPPASTGWSRLLLPVVSLFVVWIWWELRIELPIRGSVVTAETFDSYAYYYPMFRYAFEQLRAGDFPLWNPYQHGGSPFFATGQHLLLYPLNLLYLLLPTHLAMKWTGLVHLTLAGLFAAFLGRCYGMTRFAATVAGIFFGVNPAIAGLIYNPHHLYGAVWIPLHLALTRRLMTQPGQTRTSIILGATLAAQYLGGYPQMCLFSAYVIGACVVWHAATGNTGFNRLARSAGGLVVAGALALCLSLPQLLPAAELALLSPRPLHGLTMSMADSYVDRWDVSLWYVAASLLPRLNASFELIPSIGVLGVCLAAAALLLRGSANTVIFFGLLALGSFLLALGQHTPLYSLYFMLPTANWFRVPTRFFILTALGLVILAGFGIDALLEGNAKRKRLQVAAAIAALMAAALLAWIYGDGQALQAFRKTMGAGVDARLIALSLSLLCLSLFFVAYLRWPALRRTLVVILSLGACAGLISSFANFASLPEVDPDAHILPVALASFLRGAQERDRTYISPWGTMLPAASLASRKARQRTESPPIPAKAGMMNHVYVVGDRENTYPARISTYVSRMLDPHKLEQLRELLKRWNASLDDLVPQGDFVVNAGSPNLRLLDLFGTAFIVDAPTNRFDRGAAADRFPIIYDQDQIRVYRNTAAVPRARLVHQLEVIEDPERVLDRLTSADLDPLNTVVLEEDPGRAPAPAAGGESVQIAIYEPHEVVIEVAAAAPALLVLSDLHYPGWQAEVDGARTPIYRADYLFRAVFVDAGRQRVVFRFEPRSFYRGLVIGAAGVFCLLAILCGGSIGCAIRSCTGRMRGVDLISGSSSRR